MGCRALGVSALAMTGGTVASVAATLVAPAAVLPKALRCRRPAGAYVYAVCGISLVVSSIISIVQCCTCNLCGLGKILDLLFAGFGLVWCVPPGIPPGPHPTPPTKHTLRRGSLELCWLHARCCCCAAMAAITLNSSLHRPVQVGHRRSRGAGTGTLRSVGLKCGMAWPAQLQPRPEQNGPVLDALCDAPAIPQTDTQPASPLRAPQSNVTDASNDPLVSSLQDWRTATVACMWVQVSCEHALLCHPCADGGAHWQTSR